MDVGLKTMVLLYFFMLNFIYSSNSSLWNGQSCLRRQSRGPQNRLNFKLECHKDIGNCKTSHSRLKITISLGIESKEMSLDPMETKVDDYLQVEGQTTWEKPRTCQMLACIRIVWKTCQDTDYYWAPSSEVLIQQVWNGAQELTSSQAILTLLTESPCFEPTDLEHHLGVLSRAPG